MRQRIFSSIIATIFVASTFVSPLAVQASEQRGVFASAFSTASFGEVLVWHHGEKLPRVYSYETNELAAFALTAFKKDSSVKVAQPNYKYSASVVPSDTDIEKQTHLEIIHAYEGWETVSTAKNVVVAVIDSGVDIKHPDLRDNLWENPNENANGVDDDLNGYVDDFNGWDFLEGSPNPSPKRGGSIPENSIGVQHGTMVAGIIAASGDNNIGVSGVAWDTQIMSLRVLNNIGLGTSETVTEALVYAMDNGADIINLSLVGTDYDEIVVALLEQAYLEGVIVVGAAGNDGSNLNLLENYPVCYNHLGPATVIGVAAIDNEYNRPGFSNFGSECVDIVAPGVKIYSTRHTDSSFQNNDQYAALYSGTSFAAPQVAGTIALLKQLRPSLTSEEALYYLQEGSTGLTGSLIADHGYEHVLNVQGAVELLAAELPFLPEPEIAITREISEFLVYPLGQFGSLAFQYQLPGPLLQTPIVFDQGEFASGFRMTKNSPFSVLLNAWEGQSKRVYEYQLTTKSMDLLFEIPEDDPQTVGQVIVGNVDFDNFQEVIVASGPGAPPMVSVYSQKGALKYQFSPYTADIDQGLSVALWDINDDKIPEIAVVPANQTDGEVKVFDYTGLKLLEFTAYENFDGGATISVGDANTDGVKELLIGPGATGGPHAKAFNTFGKLAFEFFAGDIIDAGGAHLELYDFDRDGRKEYVFTFKRAGTPVIRLYSLEGIFMAEHGVMDGGYDKGVGIVLLD
jgi:hypothetical protein